MVNSSVTSVLDRNLMSRDSISVLGKIAILQKFIQNAGFNIDGSKSVEYAIDLAFSLDELNRFNILPHMLDLESSYFLPEHWKKRLKFLKIVMEHWENVLKESNYEDIDLLSGRHGTFEAKDFSGKNLPTILQASDIWEEVECVFEIVVQHLSDGVVILAPNLMFVNFLAEKFRTNNISFSSYTDNIGNLDIKEVQKLFDLSDREAEHTLFLINSTLLYDPNPVADIVISHPLNADVGCSNDVFILCNMDGNNWEWKCPGAYWIHDFFRKSLHLRRSADEKQLAETIFYNVLNTKKAYVTFSGDVPNNTLVRFLFEQKGHSSLKVKSYTKRLEADNHDFPRTDFSFALPLQISARDIELLASDNSDFFIHTILGLSVVSYDLDEKRLQKLYKSLLDAFLNSDNFRIEHILSEISDINIFKYHHCLNIISALREKFDWIPKQHLKNIQCECNVNVVNNQMVKIYSNVDLIVDQKAIFFRMFQPKLSASDIITGHSCSPMVSCYIAEKALGISFKEIEILNMDGVGQYPIEVTSIKIDQQTMLVFEERLLNILQNCIIGSGVLSDKYKHFKRVE